MATPIKLKRSAVAGKRPALSDLQSGELALNTNDGNIFVERDTGGVGIATTIANVTPWTENYGGESIYYNDKVGIGTTDPQGTLQIGTGVTVYGSTGIVSATKFYGDGTNEKLNITGGLGAGAGIVLGTQGLTLVGTTNEIDTSADGQQVQIALSDDVNITSNLVVGSGVSISGITTVNDTLKVGTGITASAGIITATKFKPRGGTSAQFLKGDGSLDGTSYLQVETSTLDDVLGRGNSSDDGIDVGISTLGNVSGGFVKLYNNSNLVFETVGTGVSIANAGLNTATIFGPPEIHIDPSPIGVGTTSGIVRIKGDLYVDGTEFIVNSETISLGDFVVGIATTVTTDALTDGAGIGIGSIGYEKTFKYEYNSGTNPSLKSSEYLNVALGKGYQINQTEVLNATTLGSGVVNSSLTSVGTLGSLDVGGHTELDDVNVSGASTFHSDVKLRDNVELILGNANDLKIYHASIGNTSYIDNNTGPLYIRNNVDNDDGGNIIIEAKSGKASAVFQDDEGVRLYFNGGEKLTTTNEGIIVNGIATATTFSGALDGNAGTATSLATARNIGGVSFDGTSDIDLPGVNQAGNQNTSGTAAGLSDSPNITVGTIVGTALTVSGIATVTGDFNVTGAATFTSGEFTGVQSLIIADTIAHKGDTNTKIRFAGGDTITAETSGLERLRITSAGDVGINSTAPETKLDVVVGSVNRTWTPGSSVVSMFERNGSSLITIVGNASGTCGIDFGDNSDDNRGYIRYDHSDNSMFFRTNAQERLRITSDGDVGIGTDNPIGAAALTSNEAVLAVGVVTANSVYGKLNNLTYPTANGTDGQVLTSDGAGVVQWEDAPGAGGGISGITIENDGSALSTLATTLNFTGAGVVASGTGAEKTITISGGGGGGASGLWASNATGINTSTNVGIATTTASAMLEIGSSGIATATTMINAKAWDGQTFNVDGNITSGSIFAVNDISGLPVVDYNATHGLLSLAPFGGNVSIGYTNSGTKLGLKGSTSERVYIVADELSDQPSDTINIDNGNVQYFTTAEDGGTLTANITSNNTLNADLAIGDSVTVVVIIKPDSTSDNITNITIDGSAATEEWLGGTAPSGGANGTYDVYTFFILKTADATFLPLCNKVNFA